MVLRLWTFVPLGVVLFFTTRPEPPGRRAVPATTPPARALRCGELLAVPTDEQRAAVAVAAPELDVDDALVRDVIAACGGALPADVDEGCPGADDAVVGDVARCLLRGRGR